MKHNLSWATRESVVVMTPRVLASAAVYLSLLSCATDKPQATSVHPTSEVGFRDSDRKNLTVTNTEASLDAGPEFHVDSERSSPNGTAKDAAVIGKPRRVSICPEGSSREENMTDEDTLKWLAGHGASDKYSNMACEREVVAGVPARPALLCTTYDDPLHLNDGRSLIIGDIITTKDGRTYRLFRAPIAAGPMQQESPCEWAYYVKMQWNMLDDGRRLLIMDDPRHSCESAFKKNKELVASGVPRAGQTRKLVDMVCKTRGQYTWRNGAYFKDAAISRKQTNVSGP